MYIYIYIFFFARKINYSRFSHYMVKQSLTTTTIINVDEIKVQTLYDRTDWNCAAEVFEIRFRDVGLPQCRRQVSRYEILGACIPIEDKSWRESRTAVFNDLCAFTRWCFHDSEKTMAKPFARNRVTDGEGDPVSRCNIARFTFQRNSTRSNYNRQDLKVRFPK